MQFIGRLRLVGLVAVLVALAASCGSDAPAAQRGGQGPKRGGDLTIVMQQEIVSLDSAAGTPNDAGRLLPIYGSLVSLAYPSNEVTMSMAKSLTTSDGGTTWTLVLRPGLRFSDGTAFDAAAVKYNWDRILDPATRSLQVSAISEMRSFVVTDPRTVTITLKHLNTQFPHAVADGIGWIGSPTAMAKLGPDFASRPVGAGPFVVDRWVRNSELVLKRNPAYFDAPRPYVDTLTFRPINDEAQAANTWLTGGAQLVYAVADQSPQRLAGGPGRVVKSPRMGGTGLGMDITKAPFDDIRIRRAIVMAIDPKSVTAAGSPGGLVSRSLLPPNNPGYAPGEDWPKTNLAAAQKLVDAYRKEHGGAQLDVTYEIVDQPSVRTEAEAVQAQLNRLKGLHVEIRGLPTPQFVTKLGTHTMPFASWAITGSWVEPTLRDMFYTGVPRNYFNYSNPLVDAALDRARTLTDRSEQLKAYREAGSLVVADLPIFLTRHLSAYYGIARSVHGFTLHWSAWPDFAQIWLT